MPEHFEKHIPADAPATTAIDLLAANTALSKQQLKTAMSNGAAWLESKNGIKRIRRARKELERGDILHLYYDSEVQSQKPAAAALVADEGAYTVWNKPGGMFSQASKWGDHCSIYRWAEQHLQPQRTAYLVHRLDRAANGLIILAHNKKTAAAFAEMFRQHRITKYYRVVVEGRLAGFDLPWTLDEPLDEKAAVSVIHEIEHKPDEGSTSLLIEIRSGRKHQIRRHMASLGHPVVGDRLYGSKNISRDLQLSAVLLEFICPVTQHPRRYSLPG